MAEPYRLLFVCTGNICRSPMAEGIAAAYAARRGRPIEVRSAGVLGLIDERADAYAVEVCDELGIDLSAHRSRGLTDALVGWADYILVMELGHAQVIRDRFPSAEAKVLMLGTFGGQMEIADPVGTTRYRFRRSRDELRRCVEVLIDRLPPRDPR